MTSPSCTCKTRRYWDRPCPVHAQATGTRPCEHEWVVGYDVAGDSVTTARICKHCRAMTLETTTFSGRE